MNLKNHALGLICTLAINQTVFSQEISNYRDKKNQFQIGLGMGYFKTLDLQFSPNMYQSLRPEIAIGYTRKQKNGMLDFALKLGTGTLRPNDGNIKKVYILETDFYGVETIKETELANFQMSFDLSMGYLKSIKSISNEKRSFYLGGNIQEHLNLTQGILSIGTINYFSLNLKGRVEQQMKKGRLLSAEFQFPAVSLITRLPYHNSPAIPGKSGISAFFTDHNHIEMVNHFQNFNLSLAYQFWSKKKKSMAITYQMYWIHYYRPEHLTQAGSQLTLSFNF